MSLLIQGSGGSTITLSYCVSMCVISGVRKCYNSQYSVIVSCIRKWKGDLPAFTFISHIMLYEGEESYDESVAWSISAFLDCWARCDSNKITFKQTRESVRCCLYMSSFLKYLAWNFDDIELGLFKVIQCQRSWCQLKAHSWFPLCLTSYISWYSRYLTRSEWVCRFLTAHKHTKGDDKWVSCGIFMCSN